MANKAPAAGGGSFNKFGKSEDEVAYDKNYRDRVRNELQCTSAW
jgi:hypothetical protein